MSGTAGKAADAEFDAYAARYDEALAAGLSVTGEDKDYYARGRMRWLAGRLRAMGVAAPGTVLDFGCGLGGSTPLFLDMLGARQVVGVDVSEGLLERAREAFAGEPRARFKSIESYEAPATADLAFVNGVFHHIPPADRAGALAYVRRTLKPGGLFAFWENNPWNPGTRWIMSRVSFDANAITLTPPEARRLLRAAGFAIVETDFLFIFPRALRLLRPLELPLARLPLGGQYMVLCRAPR
ncbi:MAG: class I SAM-dependent methyltransferase [Gemmatimonadaceae bacterium]|nr:class I SAM-dependent methyltransferase [Gemmatimonadaceae bacterium]NUQ94876.1 class I SAM-dependent methyltransferase [Gemmatimonadaceae bacterium]NUR21184.1 class I SAM-dependent methyltransferase [Gemmatimonadaceae bacterium]NUS98973.1 class I SAM-dependent methyltransferase [Gemmatimonadaceae bacterium]